MLAVIVFILILGLLVLVHEFGHFIVAKKSGMAVEEFAFGFPPRIASIKKGETRYSFNLIPLGGYVKIVGENNEDFDNPRSFVNKSFWQRFATLVAGVAMNFVLAWILLAIGFGIGLPSVVAEGQPLPARAHLKSESISVLQVSPDSPAQKAGLHEGDAIIGVDGKKFDKIDDLIAYVHANEGRDLNFALKRGDQELSVKVFSRPNPPIDQGATGIALANVGRISFPWYYTPVIAAQATYQIIGETFSAFYHLIVQGQGLKSLGGPVKIASLTGQVTKLGIAYIIQFAAFLSINLGILNIIPFPALDGGRVLFLLIEKIRRKRNNQDIERWANMVGFALLILLVIFITIRDVRGLWG